MISARFSRQSIALWVIAWAGIFAAPRVAAQMKITPVLGAQKLAVVYLDRRQDGNVPTKAMLQEGLMGNPNSVNAFLLEVSYGKAWLEPEYFPPKVYTGPMPGDNKYPGCFPNTDQIVQLFEADVDFSKFDRVLVILHDSSRSCPGGISTVGTYPFTNSKGTFPVSVSISRQEFWFFQNPVTQATETLLDESQSTNSTIAHELLHGFGAGHASAYSCGGDVLTLDTTGCVVFEWGNPFDVQGFPLVAGHPQALIKEKLGWLAPENIREVDQDGEYEIAALESASAKVQVLKVRLPKKIPIKNFSGGIDSLEYFAIQYQGMTGFDFRDAPYLEILQSDGVTRRSITNRHGAQILGIHCDQEGKCTTYLLDMNPKSLDPKVPFQEFADALLPLNKTFTVPGSGIRITTTQVVPEQSIKVRVEFGSNAMVRHLAPPALRSVRLVARDFGLGWARVPVGPDKRISIAGLDGRSWSFPILHDGIVDVSRLTRGMYLVVGGGKIIVP